MTQTQIPNPRLEVTIENHLHFVATSVADIDKALEIAEDIGWAELEHSAYPYPSRDKDNATLRAVRTARESLEFMAAELRTLAEVPA